MSRQSKWNRRALCAGLTAAVVLIAGALPGSGVAAPLMATAPSLGTAGSFAVLAGSGITNTGATVIDGDIGSYPTTTITGFPPGIVNGIDHGGDGVTQGAKTDLTTAYNNAAGQVAVIVATELGGTTLPPGVYRSAAGTFQITGPLTLNGDANAVWIFQAASTLTTATGSSVVLTGGASNCNVFWQVGSSATLGTNSTLEGNILAYTSITLTTGARVSGRTLALNGAVTLDTNRVDASVCGAPAATATAVPPTATATAVPPTATATAVPPAATATAVPPAATATAVPPTATATAVPPAATATSAPTSAPTAAPADSGGDSPPPTTQPAPTSTPVPIPTPVPAVVLAPVKVAAVEIGPSTPIQIVALPAGTVLQPGQVALPVGAVIVIPSLPELGAVVVEAPVVVELAEEVVVPTPTPAMPRALPAAGDAGRPSYGWWMVAGLILSIAGYYFSRRAGRRL